MNKIKVLLLLLLFTAYSCEKGISEITPSYVFTEDEILYKVTILENTREVVLTNDQTWETTTINYFNVIKQANNIWQMWYGAKDKTISDYDMHLCYAYSKNGKDWVKKFPENDTKTISANNIIKDGEGYDKKGWVETYVFLDKNDLETPYRIIYTAIDTDGFEKTFISKSIDGIKWNNSKIVWQNKHDSQFSVTVKEDGNYFVFLRMWDNNHVDRQIGFAIISPEGKTITPPTPILTGSLYNSAAMYLEKSNYIMFPTVYNPNNQNINIKIGYLLNGKAGLTTQDITANLIQGDNIHWAIVSPGLIKTDKPNEYWLYYYGRLSKHNDPTPTKTTYYRIKIKIQQK